MNILILTTIYKDILDKPSAATTPVVHNFAKEWVKRGHEVLVIHNFNTFPMVAYLVPQKVWRKVSSRRGFTTELQWRQRRDYEYERDGVIIRRSTLRKYIPQGAYSDRVLKRFSECFLLMILFQM